MRGRYGRGMGRGFGPGTYAPYGMYGYRNYSLLDRFRNWIRPGYPAGYGMGYGAGYGRGMGYGMGRGRGFGARMGYCPYTGMPRGWRWSGQYPYQYGYQQYRGYDE